MNRPFVVVLVLVLDWRTCEPEEPPHGCLAHATSLDISHVGCRVGAPGLQAEDRGRCRPGAPTRHTVEFSSGV